MSHEAVPGHELTEIPQQGSYAKISDYEDATDTKYTSQRTWPRLRNGLRLLRLQSFGLSLGRFTNWKTRTEPRKVAIYHSRQVAASHILLHIFPLSGAATLLALQWLKYWIGTETGISTYLQFAAKIHELTMQASLVEVLLCVVRTGAIDGYVPLGALSGAIQPTRLSYLWSLGYISTFVSPALRGWRKVAIVLTMPLLLLLTSLVGPSSAILMIPRPDTPQIVGDVILYAPNSTEELYPRSFSGADLNIDFDEYQQIVQSWREYGLHFNHTADDSTKSTREYMTNSYCDAFSNLRRVLLSSAEAWDIPERQVGSATVSSCHNALKMAPDIIYDSIYNGAGNRTTSMKAMSPVVSTQCVQTDSFRWTDPTSYDANISYTSDDGLSRGTLFNFRTLVSQVTNFSGNIDDSPPPNSSMGSWPPLWTASPDPGSHSLIAVFPYWRTFNHVSGRGVINEETVNVRTCTISAYWNVGEVQLVERLGGADLRTPALASSVPHDAIPITLDVSDNEILKSAEFAGNMSLTADSFDSSLSVILVNAISKLPRIWNATFESGLNPTRPDYNGEWYAFRKTTVLWGYGYGGRSTSVNLAMAVLTTYCAITVAYIAYILVTGSTSTAWNSAIEMVALALQSPKPEQLGNIGAGLDSIATFKEGVGIRVNGENELELAFARGHDMGGRGLRKIERNREY